MLNFAIVNQSTVLQDKDVMAYMPAQQRQINEHVFPHYGVWVNMVYVRDLQAVRPDYWALVLMDNSDQAGALGYHYETPAGQPMSKVFVKTDIENHLSWTVTASHEVIELLVNPQVNNVIVTAGPNNRGIRLWAKEACDMVEADSLGYQINNTQLSDFALPAWFEPQSHGPFDFMGHCKAPFQIAPGGYMSVLDINPDTRAIVPSWKMIHAQHVPIYERRHDYSPRRARIFEIGVDN